MASCHDIEALYSAASARRTTASTKLNDTSSRSHAILTITVSTEDTATGTLVEGKLTLIDLAGSENNTKPGNEHGSDRMKESTEINKSLSALRNVVRTLNNGESHVPYRDSKLSRIMAGVLGGDAVGLLICNVAPCKRFYQETLNTLTFGAGRPPGREQARRPGASPPHQHSDLRRAFSCPPTPGRPPDSSLRPAPPLLPTHRLNLFFPPPRSTPTRNSFPRTSIPPPFASAPVIQLLGASDPKFAEMEAKMLALEAIVKRAGITGETVGDGGKGKKREREEGNRRDSENAELRARVDMLEKLMLVKAKEEAAAAASSRAAQAREDERLKRFRTHLTSAQALEGVPTRSSYFSALSHYRSHRWPRHTKLRGAEEEDAGQSEHER